MSPHADEIFPGENMWLHLPLIKEVRKSCKDIFPVAEYAFTTIPTYPSGQIGFMVCCKDGEQRLFVDVSAFY